MNTSEFWGEYYDKKAQSGDDNSDPRQLEVLQADGILLEGSLLDIGCNTGETTALLRDGEHRTVGLDVSRLAILHAKERYPDIEFVTGSGSKIPFGDKSFDRVYFLNGFHHLSADEGVKCAMEMLRVAKREVYIGGIVTPQGYKNTTPERWLHLPNNPWEEDDIYALFSDYACEIFSYPLTHPYRGSRFNVCVEVE